MPRFRIEATGLNAGRTAFEQLSRSLSELEQSASRTRRALSFQIRNRSRIDSDLKKIEARLQAHQRDCRTMAGCLEQATDRYEICEQHIVGEYPSKTVQQILRDALILLPGGGEIADLFNNALAGVVSGATGTVSATWGKWWLERDTSELFDKLTGSMYHGELGAEGTFNGIPVSAKMTGDLLGFEIGGKLEGEFAPEDGELKAELSGSVEGYLAKGEYESNIGLLQGKMSAAAGVLGVTGTAGFRILDDGKFDPKLYLQGKAEAKGITGEISGRIGNDDLSAGIGAEGTLGEASAEGEVSVSKDGVVLEGKLMAAAATGSVEGEVKSSIFGNLKVEARGSLGSVGVAGEFNVSKDQITIGCDAALLGGGGVTVTYEPPAWIGDAAEAAWDGITTVADAAWDGVTGFAEDTWDSITAGASAVGDWFSSWW